MCTTRKTRAVDRYGTVTRLDFVSSVDLSVHGQSTHGRPRAGRPSGYCSQQADLPYTADPTKGVPPGPLGM